MPTPSKSILFFPRGTGTKRNGELTGVGRGHVMRCIALAHHIKRLSLKTEIMFAACAEELEIAKKQGFKTTRIPAVGYNTDLSEEIKRVEFEVKLLKVLNPDVVVSDTHSPAILASRFQNIPCTGIFNLPVVTPFPLVALLANNIIIADIKENLQVPNFLKEKIEKIHFTGPILSEEVLKFRHKETTRRSLKIGKDETFITAYLGRNFTDTTSLLINITKAFSRIKRNNPHARMLIVGDGLCAQANMEQEDMKIKEYVPSLIRYIGASDIFITRGFVSAMEMAALGIPGITIPVRGDWEHECAAKRLERLNIACLMPTDQLTPQNFANKISSLLAYEKLRKTMSEAGKRLVDGRGAERAARIVMSLL